MSVFSSGGAVVAMTTTDITGFYFLATTGVTPGGSCTIAVTGMPAGFAKVTPPNQSFTWQGKRHGARNLVVN